MESYWIVLMLPAFFGSSHGNCGIPPRLDFGELEAQFIDKDNFPIGTDIIYKCRPGFIRNFTIPNVVTCLSDSSWSTPKTFCILRSCGIPQETENGEVTFTNTLFGSRANYTCNSGYVMLSKRNYRECQADGKWSNDVPVCEAQKCSPPPAITDGKFQPDKEEYDYQSAVSYSCNDKKFALIGETTMSCTAFGNWSSDPPKCKEVECKSPEVDNAEKLSGFTGPYTFNYGVSFRCLQGYTMTGASSVRCNDKNEWEPPLPTCTRTVTQTPAVTKEKETATEGIVTQSPTTAKEKETETGGGNNVGAVVGNTLIIFIMAVMTFVINNGF